MKDSEVSVLKKAIDDHLRSTDVYGTISEFIKEYASGGNGKEKVLDALKEKGVVDSILKSLDTT